MTFYLKYRPQSLGELDQSSVRNSLEKILKSGNVPHAFLFSGPKGTGKTSAARILAKAVNCESDSQKLRGPERVEPCNLCDQCKTISKGQNLDVIEMDAASHRGIEDVRQIRDAVKLVPASARMKVYIIDEAHMLTTEASNALLKTLEEPPKHVMFILATTNPEKLIDTIRSRTTNVFFQKATNEEVARSLTKIADKEKIVISKEALTDIANKSDGSFRDASKILEQLVLEGVDLSKSVSLTGQKVFDLNGFLICLSQRDTKNALTIIEDSVNRGASVKDMTFSIMAKLQSLLLSNYGLGHETDTSFTKQELVALLKLITESSVKLSDALIEQVPLEIAVIEWCEGNSSTKDIKNVTNEQNTTIQNEKPTADKTVDSQHKVIENEEVLETDSVKTDSNGFHEENGNGQKFEGSEIDDRVWNEILTKVRPGHTSTEALLRAAKPLAFDGSVLQLGVYYKFHKEHLEGKPHRDILEEALRIYLGIPVRVVCTLTEPPAIKEDVTKHSDVLLTEPPSEAIVNSALTEQNRPDIISLAEKIFNN